MKYISTSTYNNIYLSFHVYKNIQVKHTFDNFLQYPIPMNDIQYAIFEC